MNINQLRKESFCRSNSIKNDIPHKKKTRTTVKLPNVNPNIQENSEYTFGDIIGEGGYAKVKLCTRKKDGQKFVVKIFEKFKLINEQRRQSIVRQIQIMKCIKHPNIIQIVDCFENNKTINIVMEHFSLKSLAHFAKTQRPFEDQTLRTIIKQIAEAIYYLHKMKIAHRDIKPENVLINPHNQIKIIDLGLSIMGEHAQIKIAGTPYYMSPELMNKKEYNPFKADIWAFGILLYWLVLGYFPQDNQTPKKKRTNNTFALHFPVDMHPGIEYLISKMLKEDSEQRVSAQQILNDTWVRPKDFKDEISRLMKNLSK